MQLDDALRQIAAIRQQMVQHEVFRGYRSTTVAVSGLVGLLGAALQSSWVAEPGQDLARYLGLWIALASFCLCLSGVEVCWRSLRAGPGWARQHTLLALEQFLPCILVGSLVTLCIYHGAPEAGWMLPGLWAVMFGLGVFASARLLPQPAWWVGVYYIACGCAALLWGQGEHAFSPWLMGITFGGGQLLAAAILYWTLERTDGASSNE